MLRQLPYKWILLLALLSSAGTASAQSIRAAEYFLNTDPGVGNGTAIPITADTAVSSSIAIPTTNLKVGFYNLYIRVKDQNNQWSIADLKSFYVDTTGQFSQTSLNAAEYFVDNDPGEGKGTALSIQSGDSLNTTFNLNTAGLASGFHQLYIRVRDQHNQWSITHQKIFVIDPSLSSGTPPIVAAEYFIDTDPGIGKGTTIGLFPGMEVDTNFAYKLSGLALGKHSVSLRVKDSLGQWSFLVPENFTVCASYGPIAGFDFAVSDTNVSFVNSSQYASSYHWSFGNGDTSDLPNPLHSFRPGTYNTCLISANACLPKGDTLCKTVTVRGLASISTNQGGNTGQVTVSLTGAGFVPGTQFYLDNNGQQITIDTLIIQNNGLMTAVLDLAGQPTGACNVVVVFPDGKADTLYNGFTVTGGTIPDLWVNMSGDRGIRVGFNQIYTITYGNRGNTDAMVVPCLIRGLPLGTDIEILRPVFRLDAIAGFESLSSIEDTLRRTVDDSDANESFRLFYLRSIPAGSTGTLQVIFHVPGTVPAHLPVRIEIALGQPASDTTVHILPESLTPSQPHDVQTPAGLPVTSLGESAESKAVDWDPIMDCVDDLINTAADWVGVKESQECLITSWSYLKNALGFFKKEVPGEKSQNDKILDWTDLSLGLSDYALNCAQLIPAVKWGKKAVELGKSVVKVMKAEMDVANPIRHCTKFIVPIAKAIWNGICLLVGDPNSKYGVGDSSANHYTRALPLSYVINFENEATVNANVQTIVVTDTLNPSYVDLGSFGFNSVSIGDSAYSFPNPVRSFVHDFDFAKVYGVKVRVTAIFDTVTGIAKWNFFSIDPLTNQQTTNALIGFLPPDVNSPEGDGYVSFTVNPAKGTQDGDRICNAANIVFDANSAIPTNCWVNVFDLVKPSSKVLPLPTTEAKDSFAVSWSGSDNLSGVAQYDLYVSVNDSAFVPWIATSATTALYSGKAHTKYSFYSIAIDNAGNVESPKTSAEAVTTVDSVSIPPVTGLPLQVYPIPAQNTLNIVLHSTGSDQATLSLFDVNGRLIREGTSSIQAGTNRITWDISNIAAGPYFLKLQQSTTLNVVKVIVARN